MKETISIHDLIKALMDTEHPFPTKWLYHFSDLEPKDQQVLEAAWMSIPLRRRQTLLQDMVSFAEQDPVLMYEKVARVALEDSDPEVQCLAVDLLFEAEDKKLIPVFLKILRDPERDESVRAAVANALGPFVCLGEYGKLHPTVLKEIEDNLLDAFQNEKSNLIRRRALESLGYSSREEVPQLLRKAAVIDDEQWLESALFAMGRSADEEWADTVLDNLDHGNIAVRIQAVHAAGELMLKNARSYLLKSFEEISDETLFQETVWALAKIGGEGVERKLNALLESSQDEDEAAFLEDALELLNFTEGESPMGLFSVNEDMGDLLSDDFDTELIAEGDEEDFLSRDEFDEEWMRYVSDDDEGDDSDEFTYGDFDKDRFG